MSWHRHTYILSALLVLVVLGSLVVIGVTERRAEDAYFAEMESLLDEFDAAAMTNKEQSLPVSEFYTSGHPISTPYARDLRSRHLEIADDMFESWFATHLPELKEEARQKLRQHTMRYERLREDRDRRMRELKDRRPDALLPGKWLYPEKWMSD